MNRKAGTIWIVIGLIVSVGQAQVPRDTSYTIRSTYNKLIKYYPNIRPAVSGVSDQVKVLWDQVYLVRDDRKLLANVFLPGEMSDDDIPGILLIHGGGWRTGDPSLMTPMAERLAADGYAVVVPEYRMSLEAAYPAAVQDLKTAIRWMRTNAGEWHIDRDRIAVMGCSAGGQLAALIGTTNGYELFKTDIYADYSDGVQAIVDLDGVLAFRHPDSEEGSMAAQWLGGTYEEASKNWEEASALNHVDGQTPPTLFLASKHPRFLAGREAFAEELDRCGIQTATYYLEDAPHSFWLMDPWYEPTIQHVRSFLDKVLK